jgi:RNase H
LKIVWARKGVWNAHNQGALNNGQAGSRPGKKAIDVVIQKELKYLYARLTKTALGTIDNDAKSCFNRIMCNLAMMTSQYYGTPNNFCSLQATTLKQTVFRLRTALGDSFKTYQHTTNTPIHGTGQGSCSSPALWLLISSLLMDLLESKAKGMTMINIHNELEVRQWIEGFVDNTSIFSNIEFISQSVSTMVEKLQHDGKIWAGLLEASGGKLEMLKCFYYILTWSWDEKGDSFPQTMLQQGTHDPISLHPNNDNDNIYLTQKDVGDHHKTLGAWKCINGDETEHILQLERKSTNLGNLVFNGQLSRSQAKLAHNMIYIPSMLYSLPAMSLTEEETDSIQQKSSTKFLQTMGVAKSFPREVAYGPSIFGGMGLPSLYSDSSCIKINCILNNFKTNSELSLAMRIVLNWLQLNAGTSVPLLESRQKLEYIPNNWFMAVKTFINKIEATIIIKDLWKPIIFRTNDIILMDLVDTLDISVTNKRIFNNWRLYFQINNLSELTNSQGTHILGKFLSKYNVNEYKPTSTLKYFTIWINTLRLITGIDKAGKLPTKLGKWLTATTHHIPTNINYLINKNNQFIAVRDQTTNLWASHLLSHQKRSTYFFRTDESIELPHIDESEFDRADAVIENGYIRINKRSIKPISKNHNRNTTDRDIPSLQQSIRSKHHWFRDLIKHTVITNENKLLSNNNQHMIISTDGGANDGRGSFGIVMSTDETIVVENKSRTPRTHNDIHSYRSEGMGILGGLIIFHEISQYFRSINEDVPIKTVLPVVESDSKSMVDKIKKIRHWKLTQKMCNDKDMDVIIEILANIKKICSFNIQIEFKFVKGHQDRSNTILNHSAIMNIRADALATEGLKLPNIKDNILFPSDQATICLKGKPITSHRAKTLKKCTSIYQFKNVYERVEQLDRTTS